MVYVFVFLTRSYGAGSGVRAHPIAGTSRGCRAAVSATALPRAGLEPELPLKLKDFVDTVDHLAFAKNNGCPWEEKTLTAVIEAGGAVDVLRWAREEHGCPWDERTAACAARHARLDVLAFLRESDCPYDWTACASAAKGGHLDALKYLRSRGYPWNFVTVANASREGHLDVLKWAVDNGCDFADSKALASANGSMCPCPAWLAAEISARNDITDYSRRVCDDGAAH